MSAGVVQRLTLGVAANQTVRSTLETLATSNGFGFLAPPLAYCTDNAAMIALAGAERLQLGLTSDIDVAARPRWPLDEARALLGTGRHASPRSYGALAGSPR